MPEVRVLQVCVTHTERLDRFLADQLQISRTQAGRLIGEGAVLVNDRPGRAGRSLDAGDLIQVTLPDRAESRILKPHRMDLRIVFEDDHLLVIDKPSGVVVHPAPGHWDDTLVNALVARGTPLSRNAGDRPGIVHRLDRDTSGLIIVAKTDRAHRRLARDLERRRIRRAYAALTWGHIDEDITIDAPIGRSHRDRKRMAVTASGRTARTVVHPVQRFESCDLLRVTLETGRTHQIRVHLAHVGHPVVGDPVYAHGGARGVAPSCRRTAEAIERAVRRQALHAAELVFAHPAAGDPVSCTSEWPVDLRPALEGAMGEVGLEARPDLLHYLGFFSA